MNILIKITTDSELISYEAIALAFLLASFDHMVQIFVGQQSQSILADSTSRLHGMLLSLPLYDLPNAWTDIDTNQLTKTLNDVMIAQPHNIPDFDSILTF